MTSKIVAGLLNDMPLETIMGIEAACHGFPWSAKTMQSCLGGRYYNAGLLLSDELVGFYIAEQVGPDHTLMDICVAPQYQGQGYAKQLMVHLLEQAQTRQAENCFLEVRESNLSAIAVYQKFDFSEVGLRKNYYPAKEGKEHAVLMARSFF
ncbi:ribosomal protein S18-alanine N-acetyltransferase [Pseudoalteromonas sp. MTN2-4]|uniref:ribosomal protein S18-alanine N-acetyltransferase n=1 Tax=Pseudoalteromonas sp. MTN2-4 TaxID=3056555 RepID=UPI0036F31829